VESDLLTMTDSDGAPLRDANTGERIAHRLVSGENEKAVAKRLTLRIFQEARADVMAAFHRPISYLKLGLA
jgi:hypothetical protein